MAEVKLKTQKTEASVEEYLKTIQDSQKQADAHEVLKMMQAITSEKPKMWGSSIVGFGDVHLKYETGREMDWMKIGFSARKQNLTLYVLNGDEKEFQPMLDKLGKFTTGKVCLYIKKLSDVDKDVLKKIIKKAVENAGRF